MNSNLLSLLTQIATWITVLLVLFTLFEMVKQRKATYKPDIVISNNSVYVYISQSGFPDIWLEERIAKGDIFETSEPNLKFQLPIYNLGLGAARDIEIEWKYDHANFIKAVNQISTYSPKKFNLSMTDYDFLLFEIPGKYRSYINLEGELINKKNFLLPYSMEDKSESISLPQGFMLLVSVYALCDISKCLKERSHFPKFDIPQIDLSIKYNDIGGSTHSKTFKFKLLLGEVSLLAPSGEKLDVNTYSEGEFIFFAYLNSV